MSAGIKRERLNYSYEALHSCKHVAVVASRSRKLCH